MNALVAAQNAGLDVAGENPFAQASEGAGSVTYMKFKGDRGAFLAGQEDDEVEHGTQFAANIMMSKWQWSFWWGGEVLDTTESYVAEDPLGWKNEPDYLPEDLEDSVNMSLAEIRKMQKDRSNNFMDGWTCQAVLGMRPVDGSEEEYVIKLNQGVALNGFRNLLASFSKGFKTKVGLIPIIELGANKYKARAANVGWRFAPTFKIVEWASEEELALMVGDDPEAYADTAGGDDAPAQIEDKSGDAAEETAAPAGRRGRRGKKF